MTTAHFINSGLRKKEFIFPILAFLVTLLVRTIPELLVGPYVIGFDTMGFYIPKIILLQNGIISYASFLSDAPLFYIILILLVSIGASIVTVLKVIAPLLLGFLGLSIYLYARKGLGWSPVKSIVPSILGTIYFIGLRVSWDLLRNELGLIFLFIFLILLNRKASVKSFSSIFLLSAVMVFVVLSHQLVSVIMLGLVTIQIITEIYNKKRASCIGIALAAFPSFLIFTALYINALCYGFLDYSASASSSLLTWLGFSSYQSLLVNETGFFVYCYLPLLPLIILSIKSFKDHNMRIWLVLSLALLLVPFSSVSPFRWLLMLLYPLTFYAAHSLSQLKVKQTWKWLRFPPVKIAVVYLILVLCLPSIGFLTFSSENPFPYFNPQRANPYQYQIPTSMLQNTIPVIDYQDTANAISWFKNNTNSKAVLLTHTVFYGWGLLALDSERVLTYGFDDPQVAAASAFQNNSQIYLIWWVNGQGWYNQSSLPLSFHEAYHSGDIAIYQYK